MPFALAFALVWTPLVRRVGAIALAAMFTSAVLEFGKIDAIGHLMMLETYPFFSLAVFALALIALYGLIVYGGRRPEPS